MDDQQHHLRRGTELKDSSRREKCRTMNNSFRVVIRLCPQDQRDPYTDEARSSIKVNQPNGIVVDTGRGHQPHTLDFDAVWDEKATQKDVYESTAKPLVESLLQGYNGCVITYGSPASGKTYTLFGGSLTGKQRGVISRAAEDIFSTSESRNCKVRVSFLHVSNEKIYDLLENQPAEVCRIHEGEDMVFLEGLKEVEVGSTQALLQLYKRGAANRHAGVSKGEFASKSHAIFNIILINSDLQEGDSAQEGIVTISKLTLVDLASSGKALPRSIAAGDGKRSFHVAQEYPQEAKTLKRSLTIFGNVIFALSSAGCQHVPYRESKLTRILRDCLGGNCRTSLIVTVSSSQSSVTETLSSLQFACRAMAIPARLIRCSQLRCAPVQAHSVKVAEKPGASSSRHLMQPPGAPDTRVLQTQAQTCLPPILSSPAQASGSSQRRLEDGDQKAFLPQLERTGLAESGPHIMWPGRGARQSEDKGGVCEAKMLCIRSRSSSTVGVQALEPSGRERALNPNLRPEALHSPRISVDRLPPSLIPTAPAAMAPVAPADCPNCKRERKIREEYDKYIVQARRDRDALNQRVAELEAKLLKRGSEEREGSSTVARARAAGMAALAEGEGTDCMACMNRTVERQKTMKNTLSQTELLTLEKESDQRKQLIESLQRETEALRVQLEECRGKERALTGSLRVEQDRAALGPEDLWTQLERGRQGDRQQLRVLQSQKDSLMLELQDTRTAYEGFREDAALTVTDLQKQKDELVSQIEETEIFYNKVRAENAGLREQVEALLRELSSRPCTDPHAHPGPSHIRTVTTNTEMLVVSHHMSQNCASGMGAGSRCCFSGCTGFTNCTFPGKHLDPSRMDKNEENPLKTKVIFKQLKREHNLLLDVMLILYKRGWFMEDAIPYVKRTLRKCGMTLNDMD
ncbi:hypothetical protein AGOR_G00119030 [Albula goreensis]|uniref:Kinesin motor domain-containing protein n=1 Tax=Albula goreensis TaxID=1534307 RepID=A0A8T3DH51_9TELE|nr:hypothetical protein AGOR_G00119030 [Albula goreensis]